MKKKFLFCVILMTLIFSCNKETIENQTTEEKPKIKTPEEPIPEKVEPTADLSEYCKLTPIEIKDANQKDVFKKYGIEFSGVCYACDLAIFKLNKKNFDIVELYDENNFHRYKDFSYEKTENSLKITTPESTFIFTKIENEPIYQLKIEGQKPEFKNMRISEFYTQENLIEKFEEHDCGDFEG